MKRGYTTGADIIRTYGNTLGGWGGLRGLGLDCRKMSTKKRDE